MSSAATSVQLDPALSEYTLAPPVYDGLLASMAYETKFEASPVNARITIAYFVPLTKLYSVNIASFHSNVVAIKSAFIVSTARSAPVGNPALVAFKLTVRSPGDPVRLIRTLTLVTE